MRHNLLIEHEATVRKVRQDTEEHLHKAQNQREALQDELRSLQHSRDQWLLQTETEKQQV